MSSSPPKYEAKGSSLLLPPPSSWSDGGNPYLALQNMGPAADVVVRYLASDKVRLDVAASLPDVEYVVEPDYGTNGPVIVVTATAPDGEEALAGMQTVLGRIPDALDDLQAGLDVPAQARIGSMPLAVGTTASPIWKSTIRAAMAGTALGLLLTLILVMLADSLLLRRGERAGKRPGRRATVANQVAQPRDEPQQVSEPAFVSATTARRETRLR